MNKTPEAKAAEIVEVFGAFAAMMQKPIPKVERWFTFKVMRTSGEWAGRVSTETQCGRGETRAAAIEDARRKIASEYEYNGDRVMIEFTGRSRSCYT